MSTFHDTSRICANCGMSVPEGNQFCEACGTPYTAPAGGGAALYCPNGHPVEGDYAFCVVCGEKLREIPPEGEAIIAPSRGSAAGWTCSCGGMNEEDSLFCVSCGQKKGSVPTAGGPAGSCVCGNCGAENEEGSLFCVTCGGRMSAAEKRAVPAPVYTPEPPVYEAPHTPRPDEVVIPNLAAKSGTTVEIPDIMRPLTDNDMKLNRKGEE